MKVQANTVRPGHVIEHEGKQYTVLKHQIITPGKGGAFVHLEMRDIKSGVKTNERYRTQDTVEKLNVDELECTYLFTDGEQITLMDTSNYEQIVVPKDLAGEAYAFLKDNMPVTVDTVEGKPVGLHLPATVVMEVVQADAVVKGQTASSSYKPAILENGVRVMVPPFIETGTRIVVNTEDLSYVERAKN